MSEMLVGGSPEYPPMDPDKVKKAATFTHKGP
jgi:hypothetical protein